MIELYRARLPGSDVRVIADGAAQGARAGVIGRRARRRARHGGDGRVLLPFTGTGARADCPERVDSHRPGGGRDARSAYLIVTPLEFALDAPMHQQVAAAMPLLEAVEQAALRAGVPVDCRIESGRPPTHALERLWAVEHFDRIVAPAASSRSPGFSPKDLLWILTNAPSETVLLRPDPHEPRHEEKAARAVAV
jgi:nucleotide-binding universal stress UspA family protein